MRWFDRRGKDSDLTYPLSNALGNNSICIKGQRLWWFSRTRSGSSNNKSESACRVVERRGSGTDMTGCGRRVSSFFLSMFARNSVHHSKAGLPPRFGFFWQFPPRFCGQLPRSGGEEPSERMIWRERGRRHPESRAIDIPAGPMRAFGVKFDEPFFMVPRN